MQDALIISKLERQHAGGCDRQHNFAGDRAFCDIHHISLAAAWSGSSISVRYDGHHKNELFIACWAVGSRRLRHRSVGISVSLYRQFAPRVDIHCTRAAPGSACSHKQKKFSEFCGNPRVPQTASAGGNVVAKSLSYPLTDPCQFEIPPDTRFL